MVSPATKKADLGGIDTPPSANYLVVHNPAKCSVFWRSTQGHGEISFPFGNHPPPHPLFSLRSQTATSQLAGFRKKANNKNQKQNKTHTNTPKNTRKNQHGRWSADQFTGHLKRIRRDDNIVSPQGLAWQRRKKANKQHHRNAIQ